jgi:DNA-binding beta-propeller fold protein YncE
MRISSLIVGRHAAHTSNRLQVLRVASTLAIGTALAVSAAAQTAQFNAAEIVIKSVGSDIYGIAVDQKGVVYIACTSTNQVLKEIPYNGGYVQSTIGSGLNNPHSVAVSKNGVVYIADTNNGRVLKETPQNRGYIQSTVAGGFDNPFGVAVDSSGNVYVADESSGTVYKETLSGASYLRSTVKGGLNNPYGLSVDASGNIFIADAGNNRVLKEKPSGNSYVQTLVGSGLKFPQDVKVDQSGNVYIADSANGRVLKETVSGAGYAQSVVRTASSLTPQGAGFGGPLAVAVDGANNIYIADIPQEGFYNGTVYEEFQSGANFGSVLVGATSMIANVGFTFQTGGILGSVSASVQGANTGEFAIVPNNTTCSAGDPYTAGKNCIAQVTFTPKFAGFRTGAVSLNNAAGNVIATGYVYGAGLAPQINFLPGTQTTVPFATSGQASAYGVAVDGGGDVFIADSDNNVVRKETWTGGGYAESLVGSGLNSPASVAIDGNGALYIADSQNNRVLKETPSASGYIQSTIGGGLNQPYGVAVDGSGNVYIGDTANKRVLKETLSGGVYTQTTLPTSGMGDVFGVAVDGSGNVYVADTGNKRILKLTLSAGVYTQSVVDSTLDLPYDVAVDGFGNVFISDFGGNAVFRETPTAAGYVGNALDLPGTANPYGVTVDAGGNLYFTDIGKELVYKQDYADAPALSFLPTVIGNLSPDSPQTVWIENIGNENLTLPIPQSGTNPSAASNFELSENAATPCPTLTPGAAEPETLVPNGECGLSISFLPQVAGNLSGQVVITDNALNAAAPGYTTQTLNLSGTSVLVSTFVGWNAAPAPIIYGTPLSATQLDAVATDGQVLVAGTFVYTPPAGTVLHPGSNLLSVVFNPTNTAEYSSSSGKQLLTVEKAQLTVTAKNISRVYGTANPALTYTITGFVNGDTAATSITGAPAISTGATAASSAGNYSIAAAIGSLASANYTFKFAPGVLTVTKAPLTVTPNNTSRTYGAANPVFTYGFTGFVNGDSAASAVTGAPLVTTTAVASSPVGIYHISAAAGTLLAANYTFTFATGTLTVNKAPLTVTANDASVIYGKPLPAFTYTPTGFVNGETQSEVLSGSPAESTSAAVGSAPGAYPITIAQGTLAATNYSFVFKNGTLTVTPLGTAATPSFAPIGGTYTVAQNVTVTDATPGATMYYTTNGAAPTVNSTKYTAAIHVTASESIKVIAVAPGYTQSAVATAVYTIN